MCSGELVRVPGGAWQPAEWEGDREGVFGFVIVRGLLCREVALRDCYMFELLGPGDVVQLPLPTEGPRLGGPVRLSAATAVLLVTLGESFARAAARWPVLLAEVLRRVESQRESLAMQGLIAHLPRSEHRVLLALRHLANRWGRVTPEGTLVPLALTHDLLGQLSAARRSTATLAVRALEAEGCLRRLDDGAWLLTAAAESHIEAIARTSENAPCLGEMLRSRLRMTELRRDSRALLAEARQIRAKPPRVKTDG